MKQPFMSFMIVCTPLKYDLTLVMFNYITNLFSFDCRECIFKNLNKKWIRDNPAT